MTDKIGKAPNKSPLPSISLATAILSLIVAGLGLAKGYFNSHEIDNLHGIHDSLAKTTNTQYLATTQIADQWQHQSDYQTSRIRQLEEQQRQIEQSLYKSKNGDFVRQLLLSQRKDIRGLWSMVEMKQAYPMPIVVYPADNVNLREIADRVECPEIVRSIWPPEDVVRQKQGLFSVLDSIIQMIDPNSFSQQQQQLHISESDTSVIRQYTGVRFIFKLLRIRNSLRRDINSDLLQAIPLLDEAKSIDHSESLIKDIFWKEVRCAETIREANDLGVISELPQEIRAKFKSTVKPNPDRPIYHFAGETKWWTLFEDFDNFQYAVENK
jgi:hypothetical protein